MTVAAIGADFEMHYGARSRSRCAFHDRIQASTIADKVHFHFDDGDDAQKLDIDAAPGQPAPGTYAYVCGPTAYIDFVLSAAAAKGYTDKQVHREYFTADATQMLAEGGPFQVKLASTGQVFDIAADRTGIAMLRDNGVDLSTSCEQSVCGACLTRLLEGTPDHRDCYLTEAERKANDQFFPCCSRSKSRRLVLDL
ncbi:MAG TPA: iron-sulfur cluster-binding domain-containing protein [Phenylobacterium sp.]|uniref:flavin reductase family protein n=1 Tax=Phenylobacterium sp. TaxID=1871053 RepID=UPI002B46C6E2|nr:iron-sulfur cluster-binding domain-containing protein [Phenylobacterium sp.]HKR86984.1 iron-sulfur cluster-binding domain-containing protein [Phenylobacterium sp.]